MKVKRSNHAYARSHFNFDAAQSPKDSFLYSHNMLPRDGLMRLAPGHRPMTTNGDLENPVRTRMIGQASGGSGVGIACGVTADGFGVVVLLSATALVLKATVWTAKANGTWQANYTEALDYDLTSLAIYDGTEATDLIFDSIALNDKIIFTDGVGTPMMYDCTAESWTKLTDAPKAKRVTTYYQKVVFGAITETAKQNRIEWSEEGQPDVGYDATGYDNLWVFGQQDTGPVMAVEGTNDALYVFKRTSISAVRGPTEDAFTTDGTREGISTALGALGPYCTIIGENSVVYFMSEQRDLYALPPGVSAPVPLTVREDGSSGLQVWKEQMSDIDGGWDNGSHDNINLAYYPGSGMLLVTPTAGLSMSSEYGIMFDTNTGVFTLNFDASTRGGRSARLLGSFQAEYQITPGFSAIWLVATVDNGYVRWYDETLIGARESSTLDLYAAIPAALATGQVGSDLGPIRKLFTGIAFRVRLRDNSTPTKIQMQAREDANDLGSVGGQPSITIGGDGESGDEWVRFGTRKYGVQCYFYMDFSRVSGSGPHDIEGVYLDYLVGYQPVDAMTEFSF